MELKLGSRFKWKASAGKKYNPVYEIIRLPERYDQTFGVRCVVACPIRPMERYVGYTDDFSLDTLHQIEFIDLNKIKNYKIKTFRWIK